MSVATNTLDYITALVREALDQADDPSIPTSVLARKALRIARLRNDWPAILWLKLELRHPGDEHDKTETVREISPHYAPTELDKLWAATTEAYIGGRSIAADKVFGLSLGEAEAHVAGLRDQVANLDPSGVSQTPAAHHDSRQLRSARADGLLSVAEREQILARVRQRVADYLGSTERQLVFGQVNADVFERNRKYVDERLTAFAPQALEQFTSAYRRQAEGDAEARSHALTSCRRILKTMADAMYPATGEEVEGIDGRKRKMADDKFVTRLCQYATDQGKRSSSREVLVSQIGALGDRLEALNSLSSKGVHADVSPAEVDQCLIQTYFTVGDLLRVADTGD